MRATHASNSSGKRQRLRTSAWKAGAFEQRDPFVSAVVADMRAVAQQLDRLDVRVEERMIGARDIDEQHAPARLQHAFHFFSAAGTPCQ